MKSDLSLFIYIQHREKDNSLSKYILDHFGNVQLDSPKPTPKTGFGA